jgi:hypothetical protein
MRDFGLGETYGASGARRWRRPLAVVATVLGLALPITAAPAASAQDFTWSGQGWSRARTRATGLAVTGLNVHALSIDDAAPYDLVGNGITIGSGGVTATSVDAKSAWGSPTLWGAITLGANQTRSISGGQNPNGSLDLGGLDLQAGIAATTNSLAIDLGNRGYLVSGGSNDLGPVTITGENPAHSGADAGSTDRLRSGV